MRDGERRGGADHLGEGAERDLASRSCPARCCSPAASSARSRWKAAARARSPARTSSTARKGRADTAARLRGSRDTGSPVRRSSKSGRWPNASLSVSLMTCIEMPRRPAFSRSTLMSARRPPSCRLRGRPPARTAVAAQRFDQPLGPVDDFRRFGADQRVLILRAARPGRNLDVLHGLEVDRHPGDAADLVLQARDDAGHHLLPLVARLERDREAPGMSASR